MGLDGGAAVHAACLTLGTDPAPAVANGGWESDPALCTKFVSCLVLGGYFFIFVIDSIARASGTFDLLGAIQASKKQAFYFSESK